MTTLIGLRVVRAPDSRCEPDRQGCSDGLVGTLIEVGSEQPVSRANVLWDSGSVDSCRIGTDGVYDLRIYDNAPTGVRHEGVSCDTCNVLDIAGVRWKCVVCYDFDLCTACYMSDQHDTSHAFFRLTNPNERKTRVPARMGSEKCTARGLFPGAIVVRGKSWRWGDQDASGQNKRGTVVGIAHFASKGVRDAVRVQWTKDDVMSGGGQVYRAGCDGKVDLQCETCGDGGSYYPDHLPVVGIVTTGGAQLGAALEIDDRVKCVVPQDELKRLQKGHGEWNERMSELFGQIGAVRGFTGEGDAIVQYYGESARLTYNPAALTMVDYFKVGDRVMICDDAEKVKACHDEGRWDDAMRQVLGMAGKVIKVYANGYIRVEVKVGAVIVSPICVVPLAPDDDRGRKGLLLSSPSSSSLSLSSSTPPSLLASDSEDTLLRRLVRLIEEADRGDGAADSALAAVAAAAAQQRSSSRAESRFSVGALVNVTADRQRAKTLQKGHGGWVSDMKATLGKVGTVKAIDDDGDVLVKVAGHTWAFNPDCLESVIGIDNDETVTASSSSNDSDTDATSSPFSSDNDDGATVSSSSHDSDTDATLFSYSSDNDDDATASSSSGDSDTSVSRLEKLSRDLCEAVAAAGIGLGDLGSRSAFGFEKGDIVTIITDLSRAKKLQVDHGGWISPMKTILGQTGQVTSVYFDGDLRVKVRGQQWTLNPACCSLAGNVEREAMAAEASCSSSESSSEDEREPERLSALPGGASGYGDGTVGGGGGSDFVDGCGLHDVGYGRRLLKAITRDDASAVRDVLSKSKGLVNAREAGQTPLMMAAHKSSVEILRVLLEAGADVSSTDDNGNSALHYAAAGGKPQSLKLLLESGASLEATNKRGRTPLHIASANQVEDVAIVRLLLESGCDPNVPDSDGDTPLLRAIEHGNRAVTAILVEHPASDFKVKNHQGCTALHQAVRYSHHGAAMAIIRKQPDIVDERNDSGLKALHLAAKQGQRALVESLLKEGKVAIEQPTERLETPLLLAVANCQAEIAEVLLDCGASLVARDERGDTCLHQAIAKHHLLYGSSAASIPAAVRSLELIRKLLDKGADPTIKNAQGQSAEALATGQQTRALLEQYIRRGTR